MKERFVEKFIKSFAWLSGLLLLCAAYVIIGFLIVKGGSVLNLSLVFGETSPADALLLRSQVLTGLFPAMAGTCLLVLLAVSMATPVGLAAGIYLAEYSCGNIKSFFKHKLIQYN